jgi:alkylation response protein AidB-like acyl-CoA dehydrogenase/ferredoxin-like protein FixX
MLLRNTTLNGKTLHLNMGGFVYTNRQSLSIGLVLPVDNLSSFGGNPNLLMEWFCQLPALQPWLRDGKAGVFGAKLIRGGGARDIPTLIDHGLAIGGAASAIGIDFPYPNFTGPATAMGLLLVQAARKIRAENGSFSRENLERHYLQRLQATHYWQDVEFLRRWPRYIKRTRVFFARNLDIALGTAYIWTRPDRWLVTKWNNWVRLLMDEAGPAQWSELREDARHLARALRIRDIAGRPPLGRLLLDGTINALRDLLKRPRANLPPGGRLRAHYSVAGGRIASGSPPRLLRRWFTRVTPVFAAVAQRIYANDDVALVDKLPETNLLLLRQLNLFDLIAGTALLLAVGIWASLLGGASWLRQLASRRGRSQPSGVYRQYALACQSARDLTPVVSTAEQHWEARLARLAYQTVKASHIHVIWPQRLERKNDLVAAGLWNVCPAHVYEARVDSLGQPQVVVNFENCIKCETCWRASDLVDWARDGQQRFAYPVRSSQAIRIWDLVETPGAPQSQQPNIVDRWQVDLEPSIDRGNAQVLSGLIELIESLLAKIECKLIEFDGALVEEPRIVDRARAEYLEMLARYAQQICEQLAEVLNESPKIAPVLSSSPNYAKMRAIASALLAKSQHRARRTWSQRYSWAAADGRQIRWHHLVGLRRFTSKFRQNSADSPNSQNQQFTWLRSETNHTDAALQISSWRRELDQVFPSHFWREFESRQTLSTEQDALLLSFIRRVPRIDRANLRSTLQPPLRQALLAELGRRDPSLAYRVACHLWARDFSDLVGTALPEDKWLSLLIVESQSSRAKECFAPALHADFFVLWTDEGLTILDKSHPSVHCQAVATLGLRGAGFARVSVSLAELANQAWRSVDADELQRAWATLSSFDLASIAMGMAGLLAERVIGHATTRIQFPGLFHDLEGRDAIGKFGAVKKMIAEIAARHYVIETLALAMSPIDVSPTTVEHAVLAKTVIAEALGTSPRSATYNAGQVFGGTGYSEDDILSKFYRDAAAWRFLGVPNALVYASQGARLLENWRSDGSALTSLPNEGLFFDELTQRKALQAELDEIRNARARLRVLITEWRSSPAARTVTNDLVSKASSGLAEISSPPGAQPNESRLIAELADGLARQNALLFASKAAILRTHARLEAGVSSEVQIALLRVWLGNCSESLDQFEDLVKCLADPSQGRDDRPVIDVGDMAPPTNYAQYLKVPSVYDSGDFLWKPLDLNSPRYVPEMVQIDPILQSRDREFKELCLAQFGQSRNGMIYERYIERQHRPDAADLDFCREHGFFRMPIPKTLGGEERSKAAYYLLTTNAQRLVDVSISLAIQANTSIGTTPVLLARDKDLPKARRELEQFAASAQLHAEVRAQLCELGDQSADDSHAMGGPVELLQQRLESILSGPALRQGLGPLVKALSDVRKAMDKGDRGRAVSAIHNASRAWD